MSERARFPGRAGHRGAAAQGAAHAGRSIPRRIADPHRCGRPCAWRGAVLRHAASAGGSRQAPGVAGAGPAGAASRSAGERGHSTHRANPRAPAQAFAQSCGVAFAELGREKDPKGNECLSFTGVKPGAAARELLPTLVSEALDALPIPKRMRWGAGEAQFVRPVHWLVLLHGTEVIPATVLDCRQRQRDARPSLPLRRRRCASLLRPATKRRWRSAAR